MYGSLSVSSCRGGTVKLHQNAEILAHSSFQVRASLPYSPFHHQGPSDYFHKDCSEVGPFVVCFSGHRVVFKKPITGNYKVGTDVCQLFTRVMEACLSYFSKPYRLAAVAVQRMMEES